MNVRLTFCAITVALILSIIYFALMQNAEIRHKKVIIERNPDLSFPKLNTQVSSIALGLLSILITGFIILINSMLIPKITSPGKTLICLLSLISFAITLLLTSAFTNSLKVLFGEPRPSFFAICNYYGYNNAIETGNFTYYNNVTISGKFGNVTNCWGTNADIKDAFSSFPSGHASLIFSSMTFLSLIFTIYVPIFRTKWIHICVSIGAYVLACWVAITRVQDYRHRPVDVLAGALLGRFVALFIWSFIKENINNIAKDYMLIETTRNSDRV